MTESRFPKRRRQKATSKIIWLLPDDIYQTLKEISPEYSLEGLMPKLKFQYFGHLMRRTDLLEKILMLGKSEGRRRRQQQRVRWLDGITDSMGMSLSKLQDLVMNREAWHAASCGSKESGMTEQLHWTELMLWNVYRTGLNFQNHDFDIFPPLSEYILTELFSVL